MRFGISRKHKQNVSHDTDAADVLLFMYLLWSFKLRTFWKGQKLGCVPCLYPPPGRTGTRPVEQGSPLPWRNINAALLCPEGNSTYGQRSLLNECSLSGDGFEVMQTDLWCSDLHLVWFYCVEVLVMHGYHMGIAKKGSWEFRRGEDG